MDDKVIRIKNRRKKALFVLVPILILLIIFRLFLPSIILHFANKKLANIQGYYGHVKDIDVALFRGAYVVNDIYLDKVDTLKKDTVDFFSCPQIDLSVEWKALFHGKIVGEVEFIDPDVKYTLDKTVGKKAQKDTVDFIQLVKDFMPLKINRFAIDSGKIHYRDPNSNPKFDISLTNLSVEAIGLTNDPEPGILLPAHIIMNGDLYDGSFNVNVELDPLKKIPTFDLDAQLTKTNLAKMNEFFKAYGNFTVEKGTMSLFSEFASKDGRFKGYVKPLIKDFKVKQGEGNAIEIAWEAIAGTAAEILKNQRKDQLATKLPVEGRYKNTDIGIMDAIITVLRNAFVEALKPTIDNTVNIKDVKQSESKNNIFKKIFGKNNEEKKNEEK
jgi:hypothetical protein